MAAKASPCLVDCPLRSSPFIRLKPSLPPRRSLAHVHHERSSRPQSVQGLQPGVHCGRAVYCDQGAGTRRLWYRLVSVIAACSHQRRNSTYTYSAATNSQTNEGVAIKKVTNVFSKKILAKRALREIKLLQHFRGKFVTSRSLNIVHNADSHFRRSSKRK